MGRLIDADALVKQISEAQTSLETNNDRMWETNKKYHKGLAWAHRLTLDAPTVNAVEVVKCKDCKQTSHLTSTNHEDQVWCNRVGYWRDKEWYCADGERKSDERQENRKSN